MPIIDQLYSEGGSLRSGTNVIVGKYTFAEDGGAVGTIALMGTTAIPSGATILGGWIEVDTVPVGAGASIAIQAEAANDLLTATAIDLPLWSSTGRKSIDPVFTGETSVRTTEARDISIVISAADLTAGVFRVVLFYIDPVVS